MNLQKFVESLSDWEKVELLKLLSPVKDQLTVKELIGKSQMSERLRKILVENEYLFHYVCQINKTQFLKLEKAGRMTWRELEKILEK